MNLPLDAKWIAALSVVVGSILVGYLFRVIVLRALARLFSRTTTDLDDLFLKAIRPHVPLWFLFGGLSVAARLAPLPDSWRQIVDRVASVGFVVSLSFAASSLAVSLAGSYAQKAGTAVGTTSLFQNVLRIAILSCGLVLALANVGISITPLLATLGVGSLAVALALQPTLANLFAGLHLAAARPIRVGDFVQLEGGVQGFVQDIGWRATRIRELPNNLIMIPNSRVAEMILTNYDLPEPEQSVLVQVGVSYDSDLGHVERVTIDVGREVMRGVEGGVATFDPFIRYHTFGDSSINFSVILRARQFVDRYLLTHEFIKRLHARYAAEGIEIPFPQRVVHLPPAPRLPGEERPLAGGGGAAA